jgi:hypothetical protein
MEWQSVRSNGFCADGAVCPCGRVVSMRMELRVHVDEAFHPCGRMVFAWTEPCVRADGWYKLWRSSVSERTSGVQAERAPRSWEPVLSTPAELYVRMDGWCLCRWILASMQTGGAHANRALRPRGRILLSAGKTVSVWTMSSVHGWNRVRRVKRTRHWRPDVGCGHLDDPIYPRMSILTTLMKFN